MSITVVYNGAGEVVAAAERSAHNGGAATVELVAGPGEHLAELDAPAKHAGKKFSEYAHLLRVDMHGSARHLVDK